MMGWGSCCSWNGSGWAAEFMGLVDVGLRLVANVEVWMQMLGGFRFFMYLLIDWVMGFRKLNAGS